MKKLSLLLVVSLIAGTACWPFDGEAPLAEMSIRNEAGLVSILRGTEVIEVTDSDVSLEPGDIIETRKYGRASLRLEGDRQVWISGATVDRAEARVVTPTTLEGRTGTVLAHAGDDLRVRFGAVVASARDAVFRIDQRAGAARAASLSGTLRLAAPGEPTMTVARLFEVPASAGDLRGDRPYRLNLEDPFDKKELDRVVDLETELQQLTRGFANQLGRQRPDLDYFRALANGRRVDPIKRFLKRPTVDLLTAFTIAANTEAHPFGRALRDAFRYHDEGGVWSVVAEILRSKPALLLADLSDIIVATQAVADGSAGDAQFTVAAAEAAESGTTIDPGPDPGPRDPQPEPDDDDRDDDDDRQGGGDEPDECTSGPECDVNEIRDRVFPSPSPTELKDAVLDL